MATPGIRELIIETIAHSGFAFRQDSTSTLAETARQIGVLPEILVEARKRHQLLKKAAGDDPHSGRVGIGDFYRYYTMEYQFPAEALHCWNTYAKLRGFLPATFVRSIIHEYLRRDYEPEIRGARSMINGVAYFGDFKQQKTNVTYAAKHALRIRATVNKVATAALVRSLLVATMEGKFCQPGTFEVIGRTQMFSDISAYRIPTGVAGTMQIERPDGQREKQKLLDALGDIEQPPVGVFS